jgi:hypothetical protein
VHTIWIVVDKLDASSNLSDHIRAVGVGKPKTGLCADHPNHLTGIGAGIARLSTRRQQNHQDHKADKTHSLNLQKPLRLSVGLDKENP